MTRPCSDPWGYSRFGVSERIMHSLGRTGHNFLWEFETAIGDRGILIERVVFWAHWGNLFSAKEGGGGILKHEFSFDFFYALMYGNEGDDKIRAVRVEIIHYPQSLSIDTNKKSVYLLSN